MFAWRAFRELARQGAAREEALIELFDRLDALIERNNELFERTIAALDDMRDEVRANTRAVLSLLDRLDGGEHPA